MPTRSLGSEVLNQSIMNILFVKEYQISDKYPPSNQDYLSDMIFHGMKNLFGDSVVDYPRMWHMHRSDFDSGKRDLNKDCYGRGFSIFATIGDDSTVDRTDIESKIKNGYFDLIFGVPHWPTTLVSFIEEHTLRSKVIWLDGCDTTKIQFPNRISNGRYYKREMDRPIDGVFPISFSFPAEKIRPINQEKTQTWFPFRPAKNSGGGNGPYSFEKENDYYDAYSKSLFGYTVKKAGWDCMRHYEIIACGTLPYWDDVRECPNLTCTHLPKEMLKELKDEVDKRGADSFLTENKDYYNNTLYKVRNHFEKHCTTVAAAERILSDLKK